MMEWILPGLAGMAVVLVAGPILIPILHKLKFGQSIREEGPQRHLAKAGTPTMGGLLMLLSMTVATLLFGGWRPEVLVVYLVFVGHGLIGFSDDYIKVVLKRNLGLTAKQKLLGQAALALVLAYVAQVYLQRGTEVWLPGTSQMLDLGWGYYAFLFFILVGASNAVNLTDGLDGLAAGTMTVASVCYAVIAAYFGHEGLGAFAVALAGSCLGFLWFNAYPAKIFMGDTGSLALGGALAALAVLTKTELLLGIVGLVFVAEALSVILQVFSFKTTGKRIFRMSPLHHHFELGGWSERKVVLVFWLSGVGAALAALGVLWMSGLR